MFLGTFIGPLILTALPGIIRHDVPLERYLALAQQPQFDCVGQVFKDDTLRGSCVFIGSRYLLTAAHIFIESDKEPISDTIHIRDGLLDSNIVQVNRRTNWRLASTDRFSFLLDKVIYSAVRLHFFQGYLDSLPSGPYDLALVELHDAVHGIDAPRINTGLDEFGSEVVGVGYGVTGHAKEPMGPDPPHMKLAGMNVIDSISAPLFHDVPTMLLADFDDPSNRSASVMGDSIALDLEFMSSGGDSGGGLFRKNGDSWELVGIFSATKINLNKFMQTLSMYGQTMEWTRVAPFTDWIEGITAN